MADPIKLEKVLRFILTCWDGDIYILEGYSSVAEIRERIGGLEWVIMPNGAEIKASAIAKIQPYEDYRFQRDAAWRHKRQQFLRLPAGDSGKGYWNDPQHGDIMDADVKSITGAIKNLPALPQSTGNGLTEGGKRGDN